MDIHDELKSAIARAEATEKVAFQAQEMAKEQCARAETAERQRDEAFTAGVEAMREALLGKVDFSEVGFDYVSHGTIRALPIPAQEK